MLIVCEGPDGCGKDSVAEALALRIGGKKMSFPNDAGFTGPAIRRYLRKEWMVQVPDEECDGMCQVPNDELSALAFQCMQLANRLEVASTLSAAAKSCKNHLVLARYNPSTMIYGQLDDLPLDWIETTCAALPQADVNILLHAPAETCMARRAKRDGALAPERYEGKLATTQKIARMYRDLWYVNEYVPGWLVADAEQPVDTVVQQIETVLRREAYII